MKVFLFAVLLLVLAAHYSEGQLPVFCMYGKCDEKKNDVAFEKCTQDGDNSCKYTCIYGKENPIEETKNVADGQMCFNFGESKFEPQKCTDGKCA